MEVESKYPGSFGEVLQGNVTGRDMLLSCPIDRYTNVKVYESNNPVNKNKYRKSSEFLYNILKKWGYSQYAEKIDIEIKSDIPYGKGMASSTADLCGTYYCLLKMFKRKFDEEELKDECINIEPTDSIIFDKMTLFDYKKGNVVKKIGEYFEYNILAFEGGKIVDTIEFNNRKLPPLSCVDDLFTILKQAVEEKSLEKLSYVSTQSIIKNQKRLCYNWIDDVIRIKNKTSGLGIIGAHSGNVLGIIYKDEEKSQHTLSILSNSNYPYKIYLLKTLVNIR